MKKKTKKTFLIIVFSTIVLLLSVQMFIPPSATAVNIVDGDLIRNPNASGEAKFDVYIVKTVGEKKFKRLVLSPHVFESYGHLSWDKIKDVNQTVLYEYQTSNLVRCYDSERGVDDPKVYKLFPEGDTGVKRWLNLATTEFEAQGYDWDSIYIINKVDRDAYTTGAEIVETQETTVITPSPKPVSSIRYISEKTTLYDLTQEESGMTSLNHIMFLSKGTQVTFMNEVIKSWSKIRVDGQEGWVFSKYLVKDEPSLPSLSAVIKEWRPLVAHVECDFRDINTQQLYDQTSGSGMVIDFSWGKPPLDIDIITNRHIIADQNDYQAYSCRIRLPDDNHTHISQDYIGGGAIDIGLISINSPNEYIKNLTSTSHPSFCRVKPSLGDDVVILGYPSIGSQTDITVTEGIISGYDGDYFITSAKVGHGNSGGVAVLVKDNCYLGIPSFAKIGSVESLSRILDINAVF